MRERRLSSSWTHGTCHRHTGRSGSEEGLSKHCLLSCLFKWWCGKAGSWFVVGGGGVASLLGKDVKLCCLNIYPPRQGRVYIYLDTSYFNPRYLPDGQLLLWTVVGMCRTNEPTTNETIHGADSRFMAGDARGEMERRSAGMFRNKAHPSVKLPLLGEM